MRKVPFAIPTKQESGIIFVGAPIFRRWYLDAKEITFISFFRGSDISEDSDK